MLHVYECFPVCVCVHHLCAVSEEVRRGLHIPWSLYMAMWGLGTKPRPSQETQVILALGLQTGASVSLTCAMRMVYY